MVARCKPAISWSGETRDIEAGMKCGRRTKTESAAKEEKRCAHLVIDLLGGVAEGDILLKVLADFVELLGLLPVVKSAGDIHLGGGMLPRLQKNCASVVGSETKSLRIRKY